MTNPRLAAIAARRRTWLVTGGGGFIGSHLVEALLGLGQRVRCLDSVVTDHRRNCEEASRGHADAFELVEGDIRDLDTCRRACAGVDLVLHQAALGSVPRSIEDPLASHAAKTSPASSMSRGRLARRESGASSTPARARSTEITPRSRRSSTR
jgi:UDP-N-acetylglucosamine 4-epimerase